MSSSSSSQPYPFTFTYPAPWQSSSQPSDNNSNTLCTECAKLDLDRHLAAAYTLYESTRRGKYDRIFFTARQGDGPVYLTNIYYVTSLGDCLSRSLATACKLCAFLAKMTAEPEKGTYKLLAFCSSETYLFERQKKEGLVRPEHRPWDVLEHNVFLAVVPEVPLVPKTGAPLRWLENDLPKNGAIYRLSAPEADVERVVLPREVGVTANFGLMRAWVTRCRCHHESCKPRKPVGVELKGFRVIDCWKEDGNGGYVVERTPWSKRYVALSYVWGPPSGDWPQTIRDAVEVTRKLGERYLWVDRLCIDQTNLEEKMFLISKMDAIYEGAEFTIVNAAGDARTGLPGVAKTARRPQPRVELELGSEKARGKAAIRTVPDRIRDMIGISEQEYDEETAGQSAWLETKHIGPRGRVALDFGERLHDGKMMKKYDIPKEQLDYYKYMADYYKTPFEVFMDTKMVELARRMGMPLREMYDHTRRKLAEQEGIDTSNGLPKVGNTVTPSDKPERDLPPNKMEGKLVLVSTLEEPRTTIRNSEWATRGWTYQEGVLSNRRLVFTEDQVYWECSGMAVCESVRLPLNVLQDPSGNRMADYMLSGIFDDDLHENSELQYGFQAPPSDDVGEQILMLDAHIHAFTSRKLSYEGDSLNAFLGVAARYTTDAGLLLVMGLPVWVGAFADDTPGLQHSFALSICSWTHTARDSGQGVELYVADCPRRRQFPSWTWAGWEGTIDFCNEKQSKFHRAGQGGGFVGTIAVLPEGARVCGDDIFETVGVDLPHSDYLKALTSKDWVRSIDKIWSAEMMLHDVEGTEATLLTGWATVSTTSDQQKHWLLTVQKPLVLRHMCLMYAMVDGERVRLTEEVVKVHLSVPMTEEELVIGHENGQLTTVLIFAGTVPYIWNGIARFLILRMVDDSEGRWERVGRLNMWISEKTMRTCANVEDMIDALPVKRFGKDITIV